MTRNNNHLEPKPSVAFALCLFGGPFGLLYLGAVESAVVGAVFFLGVGISYCIWPKLLPEFVSLSLVRLAFLAKGWAAVHSFIPIRKNVRQRSKKVWPMAATLFVDSGMFCIGEAFFEQFWLELGRMHILGVILSFCITLPIAFILARYLRDYFLRRIFP